MAEKKDTKTKKVAKATIKEDIKAKKVAKPTIKKEEPKVAQPVEQQFFAEDLASKMGIDSFEFLLIKREAGIDSKSVITMSEMQKLYNKVVRR